MIAVETESGELVKILKNVVDGEYGLHSQFGMIGRKRAEQRKSSYWPYRRFEYHCGITTSG